MGIISILVAIRNMYRESLQMWAVGIINYFKDDIWNVLDFASYILIFAIFPLNLFGTPSCPAFFASVASGSAVIDSRPFGLHDLEDLCLSSPDGLSPEMAEACTVYVNASYNIPFLDQLIALEVTFLWLEVLHYASGFRNTAALVRIVIDTIYDIRWFMALQVVLMLGFGAAFAVVFSNQLPCDPENDFCKFNEAYDTIVLSLLSVFGLLLGDISVLDYFNSPNPALSVFLMIVYEFLVSIVLFNMLIALMADTFVNVKEKEELEFLRGRARIICSQEETMQKKQLVSTAIFPRYLHTLELKGDEEFMSALSSIQGQANETRVQLHKIQDSMQENHAKMVKELKRESKSLMGELKAVKPKAHHSKGAVKHPGSTKPPFGRPLES